MAHIRYVPEAELAPEERVADPDNIIQIHAVNPAVMRQHHELYLQLMHRHGPLSRRQREMMAVRVSAINRCHYWLHHHGAGLRRVMLSEGRSTQDVERAIGLLAAEVLDSAAFEGAERALLEYAETLTRDPSAIRSSHIEALRVAGLDDRAIHDACAIVGYFAFVNRIADGLGVELEGP